MSVTSLVADSAVWMMEMPSFALRIACLVLMTSVSRAVATPRPAASSAALVMRMPLEMRPSVRLRCFGVRAS